MTPVGRFLAICLAGAAGTGARYLISVGAARALGTTFPYGTLAVNVVGSFLISLIMTLAFERGAIGPDLRLVLTTGVIGGFTTYSSFNFETLRLVQGHAPALAALNVAVTLIGCAVAGLLGMFAGRLGA